MKQCFMESLWSPPYLGQSPWTQCGVFIDPTWTLCGVHVDYGELVENAVWSPYRVYIESMETCEGVQSIQCLY